MDTSCCGQEGGSSRKGVESLVFHEGWWAQMWRRRLLELCPSETRFCQPGLMWLEDRSEAPSQKAAGPFLKLLVPQPGLCPLERNELIIKKVIAEIDVQQCRLILLNALGLGFFLIAKLIWYWIGTIIHRVSYILCGAFMYFIKFL